MLLVCPSVRLPFLVARWRVAGVRGLVFRSRSQSHCGTPASSSRVYTRSPLRASCNPLIQIWHPSVFLILLLWF